MFGATSIRELVRTRNGPETLDLVARHILQVSDHVSRQELEALAAHVAGPRAEEIVMTAGERLIQEGKRSGIQEGIQQGERAVLLRLLRNRFGSQVDADVEHRVATATAEQIAVWVDRILSPIALAEVLAD